jgi:diguanylate cyclase (GGDEF)-like protein
MRILLVEDNESLAELLVGALTEQNYAVDVAIDGQEGWEFVAAMNYDLIILDIMLPKLDGISLCTKLRSQGHQAPILILTAKGTSDDKVMGLDAGADDYLVKPIAVNELAARVRALLRRGQSTQSPVLEWGNLRLNPSTCEVTYGDHPVHLTPKEYALLEVFLRNNQRVFSRSALVNQLWTYEEAPNEDSVKAHIKGLRQRLKAVGAVDLIETVYGLGYRLNQTDRQTPAAVVPVKGWSTSSSGENLGDRMNRLWATAQPKILARTESLVQAAQPSLVWGSDLHQKALYEAHKLAGSLGTFGCAAGSELALQIETLLQSEPAPQAPELQLQQWVTALRQVIEQFTLTPAVKAGEATIDLSPHILIIDDDAELTELLKIEALARGLQVTIAPHPKAGRVALRRSPPDLVLLDLTFAATQEDGLGLLAELTQQGLPVLVLTGSQQLTDRLAVVQGSGRGWLQKPITPAQVFATVAQVLRPEPMPNARILAVDDDPELLDLLQISLSQWGLQVVGLSDPTQFWPTLEATQPDLLILDVNMPEVTGVELCQVLRNDAQWGWLPVVFLTANQDPAIVQQIFAAGADDYADKPIVAPALATRLLNRLERTRLLRNQPEQDALTGLTNRQRASQELEKFLQWANQMQQPLCVGVLEIDHLKSLNDQYDHAVGDQVLQHVAQHLRQSVRQQDIIARWGGAEFVVGLPGMTRSDGVAWLADSLENLRQTKFTLANGQSLGITFSAGIAQYPADQRTLPALYQAAKVPLQQAQSWGGDRILPVGWQPVSKQPLPTVNVVLVHPDEGLAQALIQALTTRGYHAHWFADGQVAMQALAGKLPTLRSQVLLIHDSPTLSGLDLLKQLGRKKITRDSKVILFLSHLKEAEKASAMGAVDYILTPCTLAVVMQRLRQALVTITGC